MSQEAKEVKEVLDQAGITQKEVTELWKTAKRSAVQKLNGTRAMSLDEAITLADKVYDSQKQPEEWRSFLRKLSKLKRSETIVKEYIDYVCHKTAVNYKDLPKILDLSPVAFSQRITMKVRFSATETLVMAETFYKDEKEQLAFIKKLMEISQ
jgi:plasmid maintenance system antidote protein VapI